MSETLLPQIEEFFISYNKQNGQKFRITAPAAGDAAEAEAGREK